MEASSQGLSSAALEINPLSRLIIRAKTTPIPDADVSAAAAEIRDAWRRHSGALLPPMSGVENFDHWFSQETWRQLAGLKKAVLSKTDPGPIRDFFLVVFSSILRLVSNADDQSQKTYVSGTRPKVAPPVDSTWDNAVRRALQGMSEVNRSAAPGTHVAVPEDGNALAIPFDDGTFDLAITSPPYLDSVDYPYNLMLEHFWLADELGLASRQDFNRLRHGQVGAKNPALAAGPPPFISNLLQTEALPAYRKTAVLSYFAMMDLHFSEMARVLKEGARYVFVVGNSGTKVGPLPIHRALIGLAQTHGLGLEHAFGYRLRRHYMKFPRAGRGGIILVDWVLTVRKGLQSELEVLNLLDAHVDVDPRAVAH